MKIGNTDIGTNVLLAPMAGCTDLPFRLIAREHGCRFAFFEMVDANSLVRNRRQSFAILNTIRGDSPIAGQLLGADPSVMLDAAFKILDRAKISFLDINCACPVKKVVRKRAGAHLLRDTPRLYDILKKLIPALPVPVTIKIRTGYDNKDTRHIINMARHCEALGIAAIFVHGRIAIQGYAGDIDYDAIKKIKASLSVPVFGSGSIFSPELAKKMFDETACDGILVARGALGNPWIFAQIEEYLKSGKSGVEVPLEEKKRTLKKHLSYIDRYKAISPQGKIGLMKKAAIWYLKSIPKAARVRERITAAKNYEDLLGLIDSAAISAARASARHEI